MYDENLRPLPPGDVQAVFAEQFSQALAQLPAGANPPLAAATVWRPACCGPRPHIAAICRRLLLPGSEVRGREHLAELAARAETGSACLLCLDHHSNFDVPSLYTLLLDQGDAEVFDRIVWLAGRKLEEDCPATSAIVRAFHHLIIAPHSWFASPHSEHEAQQARVINIAALRRLLKLRRAGWIFGLFPAATRQRPGREATSRAIAETDSYLKAFDYLVLGHIHGSTLPVSADRQFVREVPRLDRLIYSFGPVQSAAQWRARAAARFPQLSQRQASARAVITDIEDLAPPGAPGEVAITDPGPAPDLP